MCMLFEVMCSIPRITSEIFPWGWHQVSNTSRLYTAKLSNRFGNYNNCSYHKTTFDTPTYERVSPSSMSSLGIKVCTIQINFTYNLIRVYILCTLVYKLCMRNYFFSFNSILQLVEIFVLEQYIKKLFSVL